MNPRNLLLSVVFAILAALPVAADIVIRDIQFRRVRTEDLNVRITIRNRAKTTQEGPVKLTLFLRTSSQAEWQEAKTWTDIDRLSAGETVSRDLPAESFELLHNSASNPDLQAKVVVSAPGLEGETKIVANTAPQKF